MELVGFGDWGSANALLKLSLGINVLSSYSLSLSAPVCVWREEWQQNPISLIGDSKHGTHDTDAEESHAL